MANQEAQRIKDSTIHKLMAIVENQNHNYRDQEVAELREEIDKLQKEIEIMEKIIKVKEDSNQDLTSRFLEIRLHCKIHVETTEHQLTRLKPHVAQCVTELQQSKMFYRHGTDVWQHKEAKYIRDIEKLNSYINGLHSTLERNGIFGDQDIEQSDEYESEVDSNRTAQYESDDDEFDEPQNQFQLQRHSMDQDHMQYEQSLSLVNGEESFEENKQCCKLNHYDDQTIEDNCIEVSDSQEMSWCEMIEAENFEYDQQSKSIKPVHIESSMTESTCRIEEQSQPAPIQIESSLTESICRIEKQSHPALFNSNTKTGHKVLESEKQNESEVSQKLNLDPFVNGYDQDQREKVKSKSKKHRQKKLKSKPKFSSLISFGGY